MPLLNVEMSPVTQPITVECVAEVSRRYQIPPHLLGGVMAQERGSLGQANPNKNGTWDFGPMQVNSTWLKSLAPYGITEQRLKYDGCANLAVGAWIIRYEQGRAKGDVWQAVGHYHSHHPALAEDYRQKIALNVEKLGKGQMSLADVLVKANGG